MFIFYIIITMLIAASNDTMTRQTMNWNVGMDLRGNYKG
jgi:hypothetical protein